MMPATCEPWPLASSSGLPLPVKSRCSNGGFQIEVLVFLEVRMRLVDAGVDDRQAIPAPPAANDACAASAFTVLIDRLMSGIRESQAKSHDRGRRCPVWRALDRRGIESGEHAMHALVPMSPVDR